MDKKTAFKNPERLTRLVRYSLYAQIAIAIISIMMGGLGDSDEQRNRIAAILYIVITVISGILILWWIYLASDNAHRLGATDMDFSPAWSIGYYFIPIYNIRQPYLAMVDIWKASKNPHHWRAQSRPLILLVWWLVWLVPVIVGAVYFVYGFVETAVTPFDDLLQQFLSSLAESEQVSAVDSAAIAGTSGGGVLEQTLNVYGIVLALLFLVIVNAIHKMQMEQYEQSISG